MKGKNALMIAAAVALFAVAGLGSAFAAKAPARAPKPAATVSAPAAVKVTAEVTEPAETAVEQKTAETEGAEASDPAGDKDNVQHEAQGEETGDNGNGVEPSGAAGAEQ